MGLPARKSQATYQDIIDLPENMVGEILDGELHVSPRPALPHASAASVMGGELNTLFHRKGGGGGAPGGWWILDEPELHFSRNVMVPDLAGWRRERMPHLPKGAAVELAPDWVCEVISPSSSKRDRIVKKRIYAREGVAWIWLVDPIDHTLEVLKLGGEFYQEVGLYEGDTPVRAQPFEQVELDMARWWDTGEEG